MVEYKQRNPDAVFSALASASRRELLSRIARKRCRISDLAEGTAKPTRETMSHG